MPNRILRDWTDSEVIDALDANTERFFTRLIMKADDFGRYVANWKLLKSHLFPLKSDVRETDISRWLAACEKSGLIALYNVAQKDYLQIVNFKQVLRQKLEKYPPQSVCVADDKQMTSNEQAIASLKRREVEVETEVEEEGAKAQHSQDQISLFKNFNDWITTKAPRIHQFKQPFTIDEYERLTAEFGNKTIKKVLMSMQNRADVLKKNVSANLTFRNWAAREFETDPKLESTPGPSAAEIKSQRILNEVG